LPAFANFVAQAREREGEDAAAPLFVEEGLGRFGGAGEALELLAGGVEVEVYRRRALLTRGRLLVVAHQAIDADAQIGAQAGAGRVETREQILLHQLREEVLGQVGCFLVRLAPAQAQVAVDRAPVHG
jgi:hypothetical protein